MGQFLTVEEAADRLGVEYKTVYRLVRGGDLPAGKIGRIYRIREEDLEAYFDRQKSLLAQQARPLVPLENLLCGRCGKPIVSELSIGGRCQRCQLAICQGCWTIRKQQFCTTHVPAEETKPARTSAPRSSLPTPLPTTLKAQGKPVLSSAGVAKAVEAFLRSFAQGLEEIEQAVDPLSGVMMRLREARVKHTIEPAGAAQPGAPAGRASRFELRTGGWGKPKGALVLQAIFLCRPALPSTGGYDCEPLGIAELEAAASRLADAAKAAQCFHVAVLGSPTGWNAEACERIAGKRPFADRRAAVALADLKAGSAIYNEADTRLATLLPLVDAPKTASSLPGLIKAVREAVLGRHALSLKDAAAACGVGPAWAALAFCRLAEQGDYGVKEMSGQLVIYPRKV